MLIDGVYGLVRMQLLYLLNKIKFYSFLRFLLYGKLVNSYKTQTIDHILSVTLSVLLL